MSLTSELERQSALRPRRERLYGARLLIAFAVAIVLTLVVGLIATARPASAAGSDGPTPYTVTAEGITLPEGVTFPAHGHVNWRTSWAQHGVHFDPNNNQPGGVYIGKSFLPFNLEPGECVTWVQVSMYEPHFGEGGQEPICKPKTPTEEPTTPPTEPPCTEEPTEPPTEEPTTPPVTEEPTEEPTEPPATEEPTEPPTSEPTPVPSDPTEPPTTTDPEPEPSWTPPSPSPSSPTSPSAPSASSPSAPAPVAPNAASPTSSSSASSTPTTSASSRPSSAASTSSRASSATAPELARTGTNPITWVVLTLVLCLAGLGALVIRRRSDS